MVRNPIDPLRPEYRAASRKRPPALRVVGTLAWRIHPGVPNPLSAGNGTTEAAAMIVERIWTGNAYRNFNYLIACPDTGEALAIDPLTT